MMNGNHLPAVYLSVIVLLTIFSSCSDGARIDSIDYLQGKVGLASPIKPEGCILNEDRTTLKCRSTPLDDVMGYLKSRNNVTVLIIRDCNSNGDSMPQMLFESVTGPPVHLDRDSFPTDQKWTYLEISTCPILAIAPGAFRDGFENLKTLKLNSDMIRNISKDTFQGLSQLGVLSLGKNLGLELIGIDTFDRLDHLQELDLSQTGLKTFAPVLTHNLDTLVLTNNPIQNATLSEGKQTHVCKVDLSYTMVTKLTEGTFKNIVCPANISIVFKGNSFDSIDNKTFEGFDGLGQLDFTDVRWTSHPGEDQYQVLREMIAALRNLTVDELVLTHNRLTAESVFAIYELGTVRSLRSLKLSRNILGSVLKTTPIYVEIFSEIVGLEFLDLASNDLANGLAFDKLMESLTHLDLSFNRLPPSDTSLSFLKDGIQCLPNLRTLLLQRAFDENYIDNSIANITWFKGLERLQRLDLSNNYKLFQTLQKHRYITLFQGLSNLRQLDIWRTDFGNPEYSLEEMQLLFSDLSNLRVLNISNSHITNDNLAMFSGRCKLDVLNMTINRLASLSGEWFRKLTEVKLLDASDNKITYVDVDIFSCMKNLETVRLGNNAYNCECAISPFADWLGNPRAGEVSSNQTSVEILDIDDVLCLTPFGDGKSTGMYGKRIDTDYKPGLSDNCDGLLTMIIIIPVGVFLECILLIVLLICRFKGTTIRYWSARHELRKHRSNQHQHAYVCWDRNSQSDEKWVDKILNVDRSLRECKMKCDIVHANSFTTKPLSTQIREARPHFKCFLLIITDNFLAKVWPEIDQNVPVEYLKRTRFVMLLVGIHRLSLPPKLLQLSRKQPCFIWPEVIPGCCSSGVENARKKRILFWQEVRMAVRGVTSYPGCSCCLCCLTVV